MALIKIFKVIKSEYSEYDSNCTAKKSSSKMVLYHSSDLTWVQIVTETVYSTVKQLPNC
jgi:hypothetical protein